ncbi:filamin-binding LIM protein 1 [Varanus komodoensis]|uniref:filamin-binding LIM protein 1 n=1 Tax=Varanus komodoensis TaxID=61221 RepID=UPI001CF7B421|nr:filamin-binding LIM protein 1 [Varanus komodoensis]
MSVTLWAAEVNHLMAKLRLWRPRSGGPPGPPEQEKGGSGTSWGAGRAGDAPLETQSPPGAQAGVQVAAMLPTTAERRVASSVFITLAPPKRDPLAAGRPGAQKAPPQPSSHLPKEAPKPTDPSRAPGPVSAGAVRGGAGSGRGGPGVPNGGCSALPPPPPVALPSDSLENDPDGLSFLPPPPPPPPPSYSSPFSVEIRAPDFQQQAEVLPGSLQASLTLPADPKRPQVLTSTLGRAGEPQAERQAEHTLATDVCASCHKALAPWAPTLDAMNKQYHAGCFACRSCHCALAGQRYYQQEGRPLCAPCYQNTLEKCGACRDLITDQIVWAMGHGYHPECFTCAACGRAMGDETFAVGDDHEVLCLDDFYRKFASVCGACEKPIIPSHGRDSYKIECMGRSFHEDCYRCERCQVLLSPEPTEDGCYPLGHHLLCKSCHIRETK